MRDQLGWFTDFSLFHLLETQPNRELNNGSMFAIAGNVVGGSSAVNGMQAPRGTRHEYDRWAEVYGPGGEGWGWEGMLPYFKKVRDFFCLLSCVVTEVNWRLVADGADFLLTGDTQTDALAGVARRDAVLQGGPVVLGPGRVDKSVHGLAHIPVPWC